MRYRYLDDFWRGISVLAIFSYGIAVLGTPNVPLKETLNWMSDHYDTKWRLIKCSSWKFISIRRGGSNGTLNLQTVDPP